MFTFASGIGINNQDLIEVKWPTVQKIDRFAHVEANQILTIREGSGIVGTTRPKTK